MTARHWFWRDFMPAEGYAFAEDQRGLDDATYEALLHGRRLPEPLPTIQVTSLGPGRFGNLVGSAWSGRIVSPALRELLAGALGEDVQFIPTRLPRRRRDYTHANVLASLPCVDFERSQLVAAQDGGDTPEAITRLVLRPPPAAAPGAFHAQELPGEVLVSDDLRTQLERLGDSGRFTPPDEFTWGVIG